MGFLLGVYRDEFEKPRYHKNARNLQRLGFRVRHCDQSFLLLLLVLAYCDVLFFFFSSVLFLYTCTYTRSVLN